MEVTINIDAGGTFTDGVFTRGGSVETAKVPTTEHDLTVCFLECIEQGASKLGSSVPALLEAADVVRFSTTHGTNAVIEKTGPRLGLLVTAGHEETLYAGDGPTVAGRFVPPELVAGVEERVDPDGTVRAEPDPSAVTGAVKRLQERGARLIAVCLEHGYANADNERRVKAIVADEYPRHYLGALPTLAASEVTARPDDYRRLNTVVIDAYVHRPMKSALYRAEDEVRERGHDRPLFIGHSNAGMARVAKTVAINTHNSGPAAGVLGVRALSALYDEDLVAADMGGTSIDLSVVRDGEHAIRQHPEIDGLETAIPAIGTDNLGAGGGSIASVTDGELAVGPASAGANPGPACFGRGGREATVTDADLVRGVLNPAYFLGGSFDLDADRARAAVAEHVADPLGVDVPEAARRIAGAVQGTIADGIAGLAGHVDAVVAYGGAGGVHAAGFAGALDVDRVRLAPYASVFSAFGESTMDVQHAYERFLREVTPAAVEAALAELHDEARRDMRAEGFAPAAVELAADLLVPTGAGYRVAELRYGPDDGVGAVPDLDGASAVARLTATGEVPSPSFDRAPLQGPDPGAARTGRREVFWDGQFVATPVYRRADLLPGNEVSGPAVVDAENTTIAVPPAWSLSIDAYGHGVLER